VVIAVDSRLSAVEGHQYSSICSNFGEKLAVEYEISALIFWQAQLTPVVVKVLVTSIQSKLLDPLFLSRSWLLACSFFLDNNLLSLITTVL
jgi:hypothetical protein